MDEITRGLRAEQAQETMGEILDEVEHSFHREWVTAQSVEIREQAWAKTQALEEVRRRIRATIANGEVAAAIADAESD
jgi:hypothetical protein